MSDLYLIHHGIKGQKWGIRRFQNEDGTRTEAGKQREKMSPERKKKIAKYVASSALIAMSVASAAVYAKNPKVRNAVNNTATKTMSSLKSGSTDLCKKGKKYLAESAKKTVEAAKAAPGKGKKYLAESTKKTVEAAKAAPGKAWKGFKKGVAEGVEQAPAKIGRVIVTGATMLAAKKILDDTIGKAEAEKIFKANNPKKIDSFWKVNNPNDKED